uniref:Major facilitator superfamily (MFS) profile domain-containing protein n=2 Tax=Ditylum brightwellii TaxID=49249 RepID=A0A7S4RE02_9STRA
MTLQEEQTQLLKEDETTTTTKNGYGSANKTKKEQTEKTSSSHKSWLLPFYFNVFFACASFSIVMPSLSPYLHRMKAPLSFLSYVVSAYAVGEMIGSLLFGYYYEWSVKNLPLGVGPKSSMLGCIIVGMVGSLGYVWADELSSPQMVLWARFIQGLWTGGQQTIEQSYLSAAVSSEERTEYTATLSTFAVLGFVTGPSFGALFSNVNVALAGGRWYIDPYNAPGIFIFLINCFMLVNTALFFDGMDDKTALVEKNSSSNGGSSSSLLQNEVDEAEKNVVIGDISTEQQPEKQQEQQQEQKPNYIGLSICIILFFVHYYSFAVQETIITPWVIHDYGWDPLRVNLLFVGAGILSLIASIVVKYASRVLDDRVMLFFSALIGFVGSVLLIDYPTATDDYTIDAEENGNVKHNVVPIPQFLIGFALITLAFPFGRNVTLGVYGNVLGPINQGRWMGLMLAVSAIPRALGPFAAVSLLEKADWYTYMEFGLAALLFGVGCLFNICFWSKLIPFEDAQKQQQQRKEEEEMMVQSPMAHNSPAIRSYRSKNRKIVQESSKKDEFEFP